MRKTFTSEERPITKVVVGRGELAHRRDRHLIHAFGRELSLRIKNANRIDRIAKEFNADRKVRVRRPNIEDPAANRELADVSDGIFAYVTSCRETLNQIVRREIFVNLQTGPEPRNFIGRNGSRNERTGGCDKKRGLALL